MKNLPLYLSAHPISSALSSCTRYLGRDSPFLSYSFTFPSLSARRYRLDGAGPSPGTRGCSFPTPRSSALAAPPPRSQPPTGTSLGSDPRSSPNASLAQLHFPEKPPARLPPRLTPTSAPTVASPGLDRLAPWRLYGRSRPGPSPASAPAAEPDSCPASPPPAPRPAAAAVPLGPTPPSAPRPRPRGPAAAPSPLASPAAGARHVSGRLPRPQRPVSVAPPTRGTAELGPDADGGGGRYL